MRTFWGVVLAMAVAAQAEAQESKVRLTTDKPVYKAGDGSSVKIAVRNEGSLSVSAGSLNIFRGDQLVFAALNASSIPPGKTKEWVWNKKTNGGIPVGSGTYRIWVGPNGVGGGPFYLNRFVALTPSGKLAGTSRFPLAVGNQWKYVPTAGSLETMKVSSANSGWFQAENFLNNDRWVKLEGTAFPTLLVKMPAPPPAVGFVIKPLFLFHRPVGYTYTVNSMTIGKMKVGAKNETVETPAGTFKGCYRLDVIQSLVPDKWYGSFWFAPGVGLVQYNEFFFFGSTVYKLHRAKVKGTDGKVYSIGLP